jgi:TolB-like protein
MNAGFSWCVLPLLALGLALSASPHEVTLVFPGFSGLETNLADAVSDRFASELGKGAGVRVVTRRDVEQVLGLERQRQLLGCSESSSSCIAELAAGLGADALITGTVVPVGTKVTVTLRLIDARDGRVVSSESARLRDLDAAQDWFDEQAPATRAKAIEAFGSAELKQQLNAPSAKTNWLPWATAGLGGAAAVTGAILFASAKADAETLRNFPQGSPLNPAEVAKSGQAKESAGVALLVAGGAVLAGGIIWGVVSGGAPAKTSVGVAIIPDGAAVVFGGALP